MTKTFCKEVNGLSGRDSRKGFRLFLRRAACAATAVALSCTFAFPAFADVLPTDVVCGKTVEERGLVDADCLDISAASAIVIDSDGNTYFERDADAPRKIASLTKIMTAIVAIENAPLDTEVVVSKKAATVGESSAGLLEGDSMNLDKALYALLVPSGNDAAIAIAQSVGALIAEEGEDPEEAFVDVMNEKAIEIGCGDTVFDNPHGLDYGEWDGDAHSTARDVSIMAAYAMEDETFREVVGGGSTTINVTGANGIARTIQLVSTDELMGSYEGLCGIKTGTTDAAGYCFAGACVRDGRELYTVVLDAPSSDERFSDTSAMLDWTYGNFRDTALINVPSYVDYDGEQSPLVASIAQADWPDSVVSATVEDPGISVELFSAAGPVEQQVEFETLTGDISAGDTVGHLTFVQDGQTVAECDLVAAQDAPAPDFFQRIGVWWDRLFRDLQGRPTVAESVCYNSVSSLSDR